MGRRGDTNGPERVYDLMNTSVLACVRLRDVERSEGCVRTGFMIKKRPERGKMPRPRTLSRVLILGGLVLAVLSLPAASDATTLHHAVGAHTAKVIEPSRLRAGEDTRRRVVARVGQRVVPARHAGRREPRALLEGQGHLGIQHIP